MEFIRNGPNTKLYTGAARKYSMWPLSNHTLLYTEKLNVETSTVRQSVQGLMYLLVESAKLMVNEIDFLDSIMILGYEEELNKELLAVSHITIVLNTHSLPRPFLTDCHTHWGFVYEAKMEKGVQNNFV